MDVKSTCSMADGALVAEDNGDLQLSHEGIIRLAGLKVNSKKPPLSSVYGDNHDGRVHEDSHLQTITSVCLDKSTVCLHHRSVQFTQIDSVGRGSPSIGVQDATKTIHDRSQDWRPS